MGEVTVRRHSCSIHDYGGLSPVVTIDQQVSVFPINVRIATLARTNALATPISGPLRYETRQHELRLLLSYLDDPRSALLTLRRPAFQASALHIRRFVSESAGLGFLTGVTEIVLGWRRSHRRLANFDVLPPHLARKYPSQGVRPDLLFSPTTAPLAGEARGRSSRPSLSVVTSQHRRLDELVAWSQRHGDHPIVMSWAWITEDGVTVDLFDFPELRENYELPLGPRPTRQRRVGAR
jgi:hypothetical protein